MRFKKLLLRHWAALGYVLGVIVPIVLRTGRRPVIFLREGGLGDIICSIPATRELKKRHPGATFIYNCSPDFVLIPRLAGLADRVTSSKAIQVVKHWYGFLFAGSYEFTNGDPMLDRSILADFCNRFNVPVPEEYPRLDVTEEMRVAVKKILAKKNISLESLITIHAGPTHAVKQWPREKWMELAVLLRQHGFSNIVQLGVSRYAAIGNVLMEPIPGIASLVDALSLEESIAIISLARLHIGIDSGLLHVAAATGVPSVGLFGMTLPQRIFPKISNQKFVVSQVECRGCGHYNAATPYTTDCPNHIRCMQEISPAEVLRACLNNLEKKK